MVSYPRLDAARVVLAHPQLPAAVAAALGIPPLEDAVLEVLDPGLQLQPLESIQVRAHKSIPSFAGAPRSVATPRCRLSVLLTCQILFPETNLILLVVICRIECRQITSAI